MITEMRSISRRAGMMRVASILLVSLLMLGCTEEKPMQVRPITIKVVDKATKKPLEGVPVYYSLHTVMFQKYVFFVIPSIEPDIGPKLAYKARGITGKNGETMFHARNFMLPKNERFEGEEIFVNINADMTTREAQMSKNSLESYYSEGRVKRDGPVDNIDLVSRYAMTGSKESRSNVLFNPVASYSGAVVVSMAYPASRQAGVDRDRYGGSENLILSYAGDTLDKSSDFIIVELYKKQ